MSDSVPALEGSSPEDARQARRQSALEALFGARFAQSFASPFMVIDDHVIRCPVSIRFYKKDFSYLSKQLYLEYQYRSWRGFSAELLERYAGITTGKLAAIDTLLQNNINRLLKLLEQQGHPADLGLWPAVLTTDVPIIAVQARAYLALLSKLDQLYALSGTANLLGVIDSSQRAVVEFTAKKAVRAFRAVLQTEVVRLYKEAERVVTEQQRSGKPDGQMAAVVQQQGEAIAEFDASSREEALEEAADTLPDAAAGEALAAAPLSPAVVVVARRVRRLAASAVAPAAPALVEVAPPTTVEAQ